MNARQDSGHSLTLDEKLVLAESIVGHRFRDRELLRSALTHPSAVAQRDPSAYYERLEFLGDSVLGLFIAEEVFKRYPDMAEGGMTRIKISVVAGTVLAAVAADLGLADALILGESEKGTGRRGLASALENTYEALTAALYLDAGPEPAREWVHRTLGPLISDEAAWAPENPKSMLQELVQSRGGAVSYKITETLGPPHDRSFTAVVEVGGDVLGTGVGRTKKEAEAAAAAAALDHLQHGGSHD